MPAIAIVRSMRRRVDDAAEDIHAGRIGTEEMPPARPLQEVDRVRDLGLVGRDQRREDGENDDEKNDDVAEREEWPCPQHRKQEAERVEKSFPTAALGKSGGDIRHRSRGTPMA